MAKRKPNSTIVSERAKRSVKRVLFDPLKSKTNKTLMGSALTQRVKQSDLLKLKLTNRFNVTNSWAT